MELIDKAALVAEIKRLLAFYLKEIENNKEDPWAMDIAKRDILQEVLTFINTLETKEVDLDVMQRMEECPYRRVGCTMYADKILDCKGACSWVVDYPKVKELKAQKGE